MTVSDILPICQSILDSPVLWVLLAVQVAMGGFDILFHHEMTERLAWKDNAANELRLHAWRNLFYGVLFGFFAWAQPMGLIAVAFIVLLVVEIAITLWDFVEEDRTRLLPPTERILHTLLAINYGAIMALVLPLLVAWSFVPTSIVFANYGWGSAVLSVAGIGCALFALRDTFTSARAAGFKPPRPVELGLSDDGGKRHVLVTGGTGLVGSRLVASLQAGGHTVTVLTRAARHGASLSAPVKLVTSLDQIADDEKLDAIVDLAGKPVAGGLWTRRRRREILLSRLRTSRAVNRLVGRLTSKPEVVVTASAIGAYGLSADEVLSEADTGNKAPAFTRRVCLAREREAARAMEFGVRVVKLRIGLVLDRDGGFLARMLPPFDLGLGGPVGDGRQWMSWIALPDLVRLIGFVLAHRDLDGIVNATAPKPARNAEFAAALGRVLRRPAILPLPSAPLRLIGGDFARELLLGGQRVVPLKVQSLGFRFLAGDIDEGLRLALGLDAPSHRKGLAETAPANAPDSAGLMRS